VRVEAEIPKTVDAQLINAMTDKLDAAVGRRTTCESNRTAKGEEIRPNARLTETSDGEVARFQVVVCLTVEIGHGFKFALETRDERLHGGSVRRLVVGWE
jgi:hypothetical protein